MCGILPGPILLHCWGGEGQCLDLNSWCEPVSGDHCVLGNCEVGPKGKGWRGENHSLAIQIQHS